ncbi:hypothetical protein CVT24_002880 [Panaeolus cyanescens]|uniref:Uncharacterized protein n=1 Tax=Panaeolus cyanescens TaxID=181874 RepID=A0A409YRM5_9AGAR|nr:hypothetical protein CVT24_002880 [Panaeolus cyanescens]
MDIDMFSGEQIIVDEVRQAAWYIISALLQDYRYPHACGASLICALDILLDAERVNVPLGGYGEMAGLLNELCVHLYEFLVVPRTEDEILDLSVHLSTCVMCNQNVFHDPGIWQRSGHYVDVSKGSQMLRFIELSFSMIFRRMSTTSCTPRTSSYPIWPSMVTQVIPSSMDEVLLAIMQWYRHFDDVGVVADAMFPVLSIVLFACNVQCKSFIPIYDIIVELDLTTFVFDVAVQRVMDRVRAQIKLSLETNVIPSPDENSAYQAFKGHTYAFIRYLGVLQNQPSWSEISQRLVVEGRGIQAVQLCSLLCYFADSYMTLYAHDVREFEEMNLRKTEIIYVGARIFGVFCQYSAQMNPAPFLFHHPDLVRHYYSTIDTNTRKYLMWNMSIMSNSFSNHFPSNYPQINFASLNPSSLLSGYDDYVEQLCDGICSWGENSFPIPLEPLQYQPPPSIVQPRAPQKPATERDPCWFSGPDLRSRVLLNNAMHAAIKHGRSSISL